MWVVLKQYQQPACGISSNRSLLSGWVMCPLTAKFGRLRHGHTRAAVVGTIDLFPHTTNDKPYPICCTTVCCISRTMLWYMCLVNVPKRSTYGSPLLCYTYIKMGYHDVACGDCKNARREQPCRRCPHRSVTRPNYYGWNIMCLASFCETVKRVQIFYVGRHKR